MKTPLLQQLAESSQTLNRASDLLTQQITEMEAALNDLRLGVSAWTLIETVECDGGLDRYFELGYGKHKGRWALLLRAGFDATDVDVEFLLDASREVRLRALEKVPALIKELEAETEKLENRIRESVGRMKTMTETIRS